MREGKRSAGRRSTMLFLVSLGFGHALWAQLALPPTAGPLPATCSGLDGFAFPTCATGSSVAMYRCWERELTSNTTYSNAYRDVKVRVDFMRNGILRHSAYAFWDGDDEQLVSSPNLKRFKFRTYFPLSGSWTWTSVCESGCTAEANGLVSSGTVAVASVPPSETNIFYKNGNLFQPGGYTGSGGIFKYDPIQHAGGAQFLWQGDTAWAGTLRACHDEWAQYIDDRASRSFTVVQLGLAPSWGGPASAAPFSGPQSRRQVTSPKLGTIRLSPFRQVAAGTGPVPNAGSRWVAQFWRHLDGMVQYANSKGLLVVIAGLSQPVERYPATTEAVTFARNMAARMSGYHVVLSPGFDDPINATTAALLNEVGNEIAFANANMLTANHFGTQDFANYGPLQDQPWNRFPLLQSGFNAGNADLIASRARNLPQELRGFTGAAPFTTIQKPVVNAESIYDYGFGNNVDATSLGKDAFNAFQARKTGYLSWMAGASGYTFGAAGIWEWGMCSMTPIPNPATCTDPPAGTIPQSTAGNDFRNFYSAMSAPSSLQMTVMGNAMRVSEWWTLVSNEQAHIWNNGSFTERRKMVTTRDPDLVIAYLPHNDRVKLTTGGKNIDPLNAHFYNPREAAELVDPLSITTHASWQHSYFQPAGLTGALGADDWVLALFPATSASMTWPGGDASAGMNTIRAWPNILRTGGSAVLVDVLGESGRVIAKAVVGRSSSPLLPRRIKAARDGAGRFLLAWEEPAKEPGGTRIRLVRTDSMGQKEAELEVPRPEGIRESTRPSVAADAAGRVLLVWEERDLVRNTSSVVGQSYFEDGRQDGPTFEVLSTEDGDARRPRVACPPTEDCWIVWESEDREHRRVNVRAQRLDAHRLLQGADFQVNETSAAEMWLTQLAASEDGSIRIEWESFDLDNSRQGHFSSRRSNAGSVLQGELRSEEPWLEGVQE